MYGVLCEVCCVYGMRCGVVCVRCCRCGVRCDMNGCGGWGRTDHGSQCSSAMG